MSVHSIHPLVALLGSLDFDMNAATTTASITISKARIKQRSRFPLPSPKCSRMYVIIIIIYSSLLSLCNHFKVMKDQPPISLTDINIHSDKAEPRKLSSLTLYIDLWQKGKPASGQNPPVISPPVVIFRRIGVRAEIRTQNPMISNTRLAKMVPLCHLRRLWAVQEE
jgi:hypothetical protein